MIKIPAFKNHLHVDVISGEGVLILSEAEAKALHGSAYEKIVPLIDGKRSSDEIVDALAGQLDAAIIYFMLNKMEAKGYLSESCPTIPNDIAAFWHVEGINPEQALQALRDKQVFIETVGDVDSAKMVSSLKGMNIKVGTQENADLRLVLTDDYLSSDLADINAVALKAGQAWLLVRMTGSELWLGPLFEPEKSGCWECLRQRLQRNRAVHRFVTEKKNLATPPLTALGALPASQATACHMAAVAAAQFLAGVDSGLSGKVLSLDWMSYTSETHTLVRLTHCPACGEAETPSMKPVRLQAGKANFVRDGGYRSIPPEKTLKKYQHLVSPITGVVRILTSVSEADGIAHVYMAGHNHATKIERLDHLKQGLRNASAGKGVSEMQARVSALCEAIERYSSGERTGGEVVETASYADMRSRHGDKTIHPNDVMRFSEKQQDEYKIWNAKGSKFNRVPEALPEDQAIDWTPVWSLKDECHKYLPTQLLYYASPASQGCEKFYCVGCSNGNASGNTLEEAVLQGFFELVERDAVALWWYNRIPKAGVATETFEDPWLQEMAEHYRQTYQRETWALDLTSDLGIPVFAAVSKMIEGEEERILFGLGCHLDAHIALQRSFAEMNQMLGMAHTGDDGELSLEDKETLEWLRHSTLRNQPYMAADSKQALKTLRDYPLQHSGEFLQDIHHCRKIIEEKGMEMLVLDQTRADVGMPVVKVVVPGLRHFWARYGSGRLYDVPVEMGWLESPTLEDDLNPVPVFL